MMNINTILDFTSRFRNGYTTIDKIKIFLYNFLFIALYPINRVSFILMKKFILHPKILVGNFKIRNSDGIFVCRDHVDMDIVSENFEKGIRTYFKGFRKGVFVDVGANVGKYTIMISNQMARNGKVISVEPHPDNFKVLEEAIKLNKCKNVVSLNIASWNKKDVLKLFSHEDQPLLASAIKQSKKYIQVEADSLDHILEKLKIKDVNLIKLDVEGAESKVLEGMKRTLQSGNAKVIFEAWDDNYVKACKKVLENYNYKIKQLDKIYWLGFRAGN